MSKIPEEKERAIIHDLKRKQETAKILSGARNEMVRVKRLFQNEMRRLEDIENESKATLKALTIRSLINKHGVSKCTIGRVEYKMHRGDE